MNDLHPTSPQLVPEALIIALFLGTTSTAITAELQAEPAGEDLLVDVEGLVVGSPEVGGVVASFAEVVVATGGDKTGCVVVVGTDLEPALVESESLKERYQFDLSVSPRHSPTVTPFQPFALITSK